MPEHDNHGGYYKRLSREEAEERSLQNERRRLLDMEIETAGLQQQSVRRASFRPTPEHIEILTQVADAGGSIGAALLMNSETRKQLISELEQPGFLGTTFGDGGVWVGFAITQFGRELLNPDTDTRPILSVQIDGKLKHVGTESGQAGHPKNNLLVPDDVQAVLRFQKQKRYAGSSLIDVCRAYVRETEKNATKDQIERMAQSLNRKRNRYV